LRGSDSNQTRAAAEALGRLEDFDSVPDLVELLADSDSEVAHAAHVALRRIGGTDLLPDPARWTVWLADEADWFARSVPRLSRDLAQGDNVAQVASLGAFAAHPLYRRQIAATLREILPDCRPDVLALGCEALHQLGAVSAIPFLEECARRPEPLIAARAGAALEGLRALRRPAKDATANAQAAPAGGR
jgi:HEAT repeat protein